MIIPAKFQWSKENEPDYCLRINSITRKYNTCLKKCGNLYSNIKQVSNREVQIYSFQKNVMRPNYLQINE